MCSTKPTHCLSSNTVDTLQQTPAIQIGKTCEGEIPGFSTRFVELVFAPEDAIEHMAEFYITFSDPSLEPVSIPRCHNSGTFKI